MIDNQYSYYQMYSVGGIENIGPGYGYKKLIPCKSSVYKGFFVGGGATVGPRRQ